MRIATMGFPRISACLAQTLSSQGIDAVDCARTSSPLPDADVYHEVFAGSAHQTFYASLAGKKIVRHWVGSDVLCYHNLRPRSIQMQLLSRIYSRVTTASAAVWDNLAKELPFDSTVLPIVTEDYSKATPNKSAGDYVLCYSALGKEWTYGLDTIAATAALLTDTKFRVVGQDRTTTHLPKNVELIGLLSRPELEKEYRTAFAYYRPSRHDGLPGMVMESLARRLPVIYSSTLPHCLMSSSPQGDAAVLRELEQDRRLLPQSARQWVSSEFAPQKVAAKYAAFYEGL